MTRRRNARGIQHAAHDARRDAPLRVRNSGGEDPRSDGRILFTASQDSARGTQRILGCLLLALCLLMPRLGFAAEPPAETRHEYVLTLKPSTENPLDVGKAVAARFGIAIDAQVGGEITAQLTFQEAERIHRDPRVNRVRSRERIEAEAWAASVTASDPQSGAHGSAVVRGTDASAAPETARRQEPRDPRPRYFLMLHPSRPGANKPDIVRHGGKVEREQGNRMLVRLPEPAVEALRRHERVKFIQRIVPVEEAEARLAFFSSTGEAGVSKEPAATSTTSVTESLLASAAEQIPPRVVPNAATWSTGAHTYDKSGNIITIGPNSDAKTNYYTYDAFGRLTTATAHEAAENNQESYQYDVYGNLIEKVTNGSALTIAVDAATNRIAPSMGAVYDEGGSMTRWGAMSYSYTPDGLLRKMEDPAVSFEYVYDAQGERIGIYNIDTHEWRWTIRDMAGRVVREYGSFAGDNNWWWVEDHVYRDGQVVASQREEADGGLRYYHLDHLGTPRLVTNGAGQRISEHVLYPFGVDATSMRQETAQGYPHEKPFNFTGHERDLNGGVLTENTAYLDYMHARYYNPVVGRFLSVDPHLDLKGAAASPQGWNRYSYVTNNPLRYSDPNGRDRWDVANGFFNAYFSDFGITVRRSGNADFQRGQRAGDQAAVTTGGILITASPTISGGVTLGTGGAGAITIPGALVAVGVGTVAVANGSQNLMESSGNQGGGGSDDPDRNPAQDKLLSKGEIEKLEKAGHDVHELKGGKNASRYDLYKDKKGNVYVKPKKGKGPGDETNINLNELE